MSTSQFVPRQPASSDRVVGVEMQGKAVGCGKLGFDAKLGVCCETGGKRGGVRSKANGNFASPRAERGFESSEHSTTSTKEFAS